MTTSLIPQPLIWERLILDLFDVAKWAAPLLHIEDEGAEIIAEVTAETNNDSYRGHDLEFEDKYDTYENSDLVISLNKLLVQSYTGLEEGDSVLFWISW